MRQSSDADAPSRFPPTRWSLILSVGSTDRQGQAALNEICQLYWFPVYAYVRSWGRTPEDAEDIAQGFFAQMLSRESFHRADPGRGRFRSFILQSLKHFLHNLHRYETRRKRGGGVRVISLDATEAERRFLAEPATEVTPELVFERRWALEIMQTALTQLETEYRRAGRGYLYDVLSPFLSRRPTSAQYAAAASRLWVEVNTARTHVFRLRQRYGRVIREEISHTLEDPAEVEEELRHLAAVLSGDPAGLPGAGDIG